MLPRAPRPWTWLRQVHGADVVVVTEPGQHAGAPADAAVTDRPGCALAVRTADCAPVVLAGDGVVGLAHAGWRGVAAGVLESTVAALRDLAPGPLVAHLGPCIRPGCYEFDGLERDELAARLGPAVAATTSWGTPALDVPAAVRAVLAELDVPVRSDVDAGCTACDDRWFSHRATGDARRFATVAWLEPA
ncbi:MAG TPA: polyphenol oxidase family protein [Acidimicrobiales bacterium]|nr:polyphenol oxidase family protein [Acidimicrobiales bacterium]